MSELAVRLIEATLPAGGGCVVNLVEAYFDESGSHSGSPVLCVAGYLLDSENAKPLTKEWTDVLAPKGLTHFRMVDCAHGAGEFAKLSRDERIAVAKALIADHQVTHPAWHGCACRSRAVQRADAVPSEPRRRLLLLHLELATWRQPMAKGGQLRRRHGLLL